MAITVRDLVEEYKLKVVSGDKGLDNKITHTQITRPGVELAGMFDFYECDRLQIIGSKEVAFFGWLNEHDQDIRVRMLFECSPPAFVFSANAEIPEVFLKYSEQYGVPILKSIKKTSALLSGLYQFLSRELAERMSLHGTLLDISGVGVLIRGKSGLGKSEVALELIRRGHQLVADDRVDIYERERGVIVGEAPDILKKYLEIRGIGIINVVQMFGAKAYKESKKIMLVVDLELWDQKSDYDRLGLNNDFLTFFETEIRNVKIPVSTGRNVASLVEVAAVNSRLKYMGTNAAQEFADSVDRALRENNKKKEEE